MSVDWETADGTAQSTTDYAEAASTLIIPAGQTSGTIADSVWTMIHCTSRTRRSPFASAHRAAVTLGDDEAIGTIV